MTGDKTKNKTEDKLGFTLIEVMVSVVLFTVIIMSVTSIFKMAINAQRNAIAAQNVQESMKYFFEITGKEIRMAVKNNGSCDVALVPVGAVFGIGYNSYGDTLNFKNYTGDCVTYFLQKDYNGVLRFAVSRKNNDGTKTDFISPEKISVNTLHFVLRSGPTLPAPQSMITMNMNASSLGNSKFQSNMTLQTSISSRYYKKN